MQQLHLTAVTDERSCALGGGCGVVARPNATEDHVNSIFKKKKKIHTKRGDVQEKKKLNRKRWEKRPEEKKKKKKKIHSFSIFLLSTTPMLLMLLLLSPASCTCVCLFKKTQSKHTNKRNDDYHPTRGVRFSISIFQGFQEEEKSISNVTRQVDWMYREEGTLSRKMTSVHLLLLFQKGRHKNKKKIYSLLFWTGSGSPSNEWQYVKYTHRETICLLTFFYTRGKPAGRGATL